MGLHSNGLWGGAVRLWEIREEGEGEGEEDRKGARSGGRQRNWQANAKNFTESRIGNHAIPASQIWNRQNFCCEKPKMSQ